MKIFKEGDTTKAACECCGEFQQASFQLRDMPFSDGSGIVKSVLVGVCEACDNVAVVPHQSTPAIQKELDKQRKAVEGRVPAHFVDILNLASSELGASTDFSVSLIKFYIHGLSTNQISSENLSAFLCSDLAQGKANKRLSIKGRHIADEAELLKRHADIASTTDLLKSVVLKIHDEILVHKHPKRIKDLQHVVAAMA